jgi:hypothetical protein
VKPRLWFTDPDTGLHGVFPQAFSLREKDGVKEAYLSAAWLEVHDGDREQQVAAVKAEFRASMDVRPRAAFALGIVAAIKGVCAQFGDRLRVSHEPDPPLNSHVAVRRYQDEPMELLEGLATGAWSELRLGLHG